MRKFFLLSVLLPFGLLGQVTDDFSDGDLSQDPAWWGDLSHFKTSTSSAVPEEMRPALQLDAPGAGQSAISVNTTWTEDLEWQCWIKLSFNTSSGNFARFYLSSDQADLNVPLQGYYLQIGGADDSVLFCRQDSLDVTRLLCLHPLFTGNSTNTFRFKILRNARGDWGFFADSLGGDNLILRGEINDLSYPEGDYCGIRFQYTASNTAKFYFDDFYAGPRIIDSIPPELLSVDALSPSEFLLTFNEALKKSSAENLLNYSVLPDIGKPIDAALLQEDPRMLHLFFGQGLQTGVSYTLNISAIEDLSGNVSDPVSMPVWYYRLQPYDLVFTEIMADPSPPFDLPEYEYLELFNRSPYPLNLGGLSLCISSSSHELPNAVIDPGQYLLLCDDEAAPVMSHIGKTIGLSSFNLPNSGAPLQLSDTSGQTICYLPFELSWYDNDTKSEGGWSLEMIDTENPCVYELNWSSSVNSTGGTPGKENSVRADLNPGFSILNACCLDEYQIEVVFSESLDSIYATDISLYRVGPYMGNPILVTPVGPGFATLHLRFGENFSADQIYTLHVSPGLKNCTGQEIQAELQSPFALPQKVQPFDIILNEILFNPLGDGVDYVEIYNRSAKAIDLEGLVLASVKHSPPNPPDTQTAFISSSCKTILPSQYLLLTSDPEKVQQQYYCPEPGAFHKMDPLPSYNNEQGFVLLMNNENQVIDGLHYSEDMHFMMLLSTDGVSLERIYTDRLGDDPGNWHSAAETSGFGTPGYQNSQYLEMESNEEAFFLQPEIFSPDSDGVDDQLGIGYSFNNAGKLITILVFNVEGRLVRTLVNNEMPGTRGLYSWDGTLDDRTPARNGIYIVYMEALGMDGKTTRFKKACVLTRNR